MPWRPTDEMRSLAEQVWLEYKHEHPGPSRPGDLYMVSTHASDEQIRLEHRLGSLVSRDIPPAVRTHIWALVDNRTGLARLRPPRFTDRSMVFGDLRDLANTLRPFSDLRAIHVGALTAVVLAHGLDPSASDVDPSAVDTSGPDGFVRRNHVESALSTVRHRVANLALNGIPHTVGPPTIEGQVLAP